MTNSKFIKNTLLALSILSTSSAIFTPTALGETPPAVPALEQTVEAPALTGTFKGRTDHVTKGKVTITKNSTGYVLTLSDNFYLDGAPDPVIGFGTSGKYIKTSQVADLKSKRGAQTYQLPQGFNPAQFNEVYVWCDKFSVPLGVAKLR